MKFFEDFSFLSEAEIADITNLSISYLQVSFSTPQYTKLENFKIAIFHLTNFLKKIPLSTKKFSLANLTKITTLVNNILAYSVKNEDRQIQKIVGILAEKLLRKIQKSKNPYNFSLLSNSLFSLYSKNGQIGLAEGVVSASIKTSSKWLKENIGNRKHQIFEKNLEILLLALMNKAFLYKEKQNEEREGMLLKKAEKLMKKFCCKNEIIRKKLCLMLKRNDESFAFSSERKKGLFIKKTKQSKNRSRRRATSNKKKFIEERTTRISFSPTNQSRSRRRKLILQNQKKSKKSKKFKIKGYRLSKSYSRRRRRRPSESDYSALNISQNQPLHQSSPNRPKTSLEQIRNQREHSQSSRRRKRSSEFRIKQKTKFQNYGQNHRYEVKNIFNERIVPYPIPFYHGYPPQQFLQQLPASGQPYILPDGRMYIPARLVEKDELKGKNVKGKNVKGENVKGKSDKGEMGKGRKEELSEGDFFELCEMSEKIEKEIMGEEKMDDTVLKTGDLELREGEEEAKVFGHADTKEEEEEIKEDIKSLTKNKDCEDTDNREEEKEDREEEEDRMDFLKMRDTQGYSIGVFQESFSSSCKSEELHIRDQLSLIEEKNKALEETGEREKLIKLQKVQGISQELLPDIKNLQNSPSKSSSIFTESDRLKGKLKPQHMNKVISRTETLPSPNHKGKNGSPRFSTNTASKGGSHNVKRPSNIIGLEEFEFSPLKPKTKNLKFRQSMAVNSVNEFSKDGSNRRIKRNKSEMPSSPNLDHSPSHQHIHLSPSNLGAPSLSRAQSFVSNVSSMLQSNGNMNSSLITPFLVYLKFALHFTKKERNKGKWTEFLRKEVKQNGNQYLFDFYIYLEYDSDLEAEQVCLKIQVHEYDKEEEERGPQIWTEILTENQLVYILSNLHHEDIIPINYPISVFKQLSLFINFILIHYIKVFSLINFSLIDQPKFRS